MGYINKEKHKLAQIPRAPLRTSRGCRKEEAIVVEEGADLCAVQRGARPCVRVELEGARADPECEEVERIRSAEGARSSCGNSVASLDGQVASACAEAEVLCQPPAPCCSDCAQDSVTAEGAPCAAPAAPPLGGRGAGRLRRMGLCVALVAPAPGGLGYTCQRPTPGRTR